MRTRQLGAHAIQVTEMGLGTWGLSGDAYGPVPEAEQDSVIDRALAIGIRLFETADCYAEGKMEIRLGQRLPADAWIVTKLGTRRDQTPARKDFSVAYLRQSLEASRERLRRESINCVLLHNPSSRAFANSGVSELLEELRSRGVIQVWGASVGTVESGRAALNAGAQVLELAYNLFHTGDLQTLRIDLEQHKPGVLVRSVLSHGLLCGLWPPNKDFPDGDHRRERWSSDELKRRIVQLNAVRTLLSNETPTLRSIALRFALADPAVASVVVGPRNARQLDQLVRESGKGPPYIEPERLQALRERLLAVGVLG